MRRARRRSRVPWRLSRRFRLRGIRLRLRLRPELNRADGRTTCPAPDVFLASVHRARRQGRGRSLQKYCAGLTPLRRRHVLFFRLRPSQLPHWRHSCPRYRPDDPPYVPPPILSALSPRVSRNAGAWHQISRTTRMAEFLLALPKSCRPHLRTGLILCRCADPSTRDRDDHMVGIKLVEPGPEYAQKGNEDKQPAHDV